MSVVHLHGAVEDRLAVFVLADLQIGRVAVTSMKLPAE